MGREKRILIVDDSEDMRTLLAQILEEVERYTLVFAENGMQALTEARRVQPQLILMDMALPGLSGWDVVKQLRAQPAFAQTPIIAITAHVLPEDRKRALAVGCNAYLGKPFNVAEVLDTVASIFEMQENTVV